MNKYRMWISFPGAYYTIEAKDDVAAVARYEHCGTQSDRDHIQRLNQISGEWHYIF